MAVKTFKFKLYESKRNKKLKKQILAAGLTYNLCVKLHKRYYRLFHKTLLKKKLQSHLTKLKKNKQKYWYLSAFGSQAVQEITDRIERGYEKFFRHENKHPPRLRKIHKHKSFTLKQAGWKLDEEHHAITINKQKYCYFKSRSIEGQIKTITVKKDTIGDIYIFIVCKVNQLEVMPRMGKSIGFDFGLKDHILVAPTEKDDVDMPRFFKRDKKKLIHEQQKLSSKIEANILKKVKSGKGLRPIWKKPLSECRNIQKQRLIIARLHKDITNRREAFHWHLAYKLCSQYALICLEDLNMKWMQIGHGKKVGDYGFADFVKILQYVASRCGTIIIKVDRFYPSSQLCSGCGYQNREVKNLKIREWTCPKCGKYHDRDRNAAKNILKKGFQIFEASYTAL